MDSDPRISVFIVLILIYLASWFAVTETAIASSSRNKLKSSSEHGDYRADDALFALDNFDRALDTPCSDENFKKGIEMIFTQINDIMTKIGVTEIEALNKPFDPNLHNAIKQVEDENAESDTVCEVFQKGYKLGDRIIRHSMVAVNA